MDEEGNIYDTEFNFVGQANDDDWMGALSINDSKFLFYIIINNYILYSTLNGL